MYSNGNPQSMLIDDSNARVEEQCTFDCDMMHDAVKLIVYSTSDSSKKGMVYLNVHIECCKFHFSQDLAIDLLDLLFFCV